MSGNKTMDDELLIESVIKLRSIGNETASRRFNSAVKLIENHECKQNFLNKISALLPPELVPKEINEEAVLKAISQLRTERDNSLYALLNGE